MNKNEVLNIVKWEQILNEHVKPNGGIMFSSSGSTGNSKSVIYDNDIINNANRRLEEVLKWTPIEKNSKIVMLWGYGLFPPAYYYTDCFSKLGHIVYPLGSGKNYPTELKVDRIYEILPNAMVGMPSYILKIGEMLIERGLMDEVKKHLKFFITGGEALTNILRLKIETMYGAKIYDSYGMLHCPMIAGECDFGILHLSEEFKAEVLMDDGSIKSTGRGVLLLSSNSISSGLNMERLLTEDIVELKNSDCKCGCKNAYIKILGRSSFNIKIKGNTIDLQSMIEDLDKIDSVIGKYYLEIIKDPVDSLTIHVSDKTDINKMKEILNKYLHFNYNLSIEHDINIPMTQTGKQRKIIKRDNIENKEYDLI